VLSKTRLITVSDWKLEIAKLTIKAPGSDFEVGSLSRILARRLHGYEMLPEWTDDPSDSSLRDVEVSFPSFASVR
jgi:hypothetical protein